MIQRGVMSGVSDNSSHRMEFAPAMAENALVLLSPVGGKPDVAFDGTCFLLAVDRWRGAGVEPVSVRLVSCRAVADQEQALGVTEQDADIRAEMLLLVKRDAPCCLTWPLV